VKDLPPISERPNVDSRQAWRAMSQISGDGVALPTSQLVRFAYACPHGSFVEGGPCTHAATQDVEHAGAWPQCPVHHIQMVSIGSIYHTPHGYMRYPG
jgi:hypothetical protein